MAHKEPFFVLAQDAEEMQSVLLAAAIQGDETCRGQLPQLHRGFEEPYRTIAGVAIEQMSGGGLLDANTIRAALEGRKLTRRNADGKAVTLSAQQAIDLICATPVLPGQAIAYLPLLQDRLDAQRRAEFRDRSQEAA